MIQTEKELWAALAGSEDARLLFGLLMRESGVFAPAAMTEANATYFREGERAVGLRIFNALVGADADPLQCMREFAAWLKVRTDLKEQE